MYSFIQQTRVDKKTQTVSETHKGKLFKLVEKKCFLLNQQITTSKTESFLEITPFELLL